MLMDKSEMDKRLSSPDNLLNRLRDVGAKKGTIDIITGSSYSEKPSADNTFSPPSVDDLIEDASNKIEVGSAHNGALRVRTKALRLLEDLLPLETSPVKISRIATDMSRIASDIRGEVLDGKAQNITPIIFKPMFVEEASFNIIQVND